MSLCCNSAYNLNNGTTKWLYGNANSALNIPAIKRLICEANQDGKLYGTIEDVNEIIRTYYGD